MNEALIGIIVGSAITGLISIFFNWVSSLKNAKENKDQKTISDILETLKVNAEKELQFKEEWGGFKTEVRSISVSADIIKDASKEIIVLRRDLDTCFKRIDELRGLYSENNLLLKTANSRLFLLRQTLEKKDFKIDSEAWLNPRDHIEV